MGEPKKDIAEIEKYANVEDTLTNPRNPEILFSKSRTNRIHMQVQANGKNNREQAVIDKMEKHKK